MASHLTLRAACGAALVFALGVLSAAPSVRAAPLTSSLTLRYDVSPAGTTDQTIVIRAAGAPPRGPVDLVDASGLHVVAARPLQTNLPECRAARERRTGLGDQMWCYELEGVRPGVSVSGKLRGAETVVGLTVTARHALIWPAIAAVIAAIAAAIFVWLTTYGLSSFVTRLRLRRAVQLHKTNIEGLEGWATDAEDRLSETEQLERVTWMHKHGVPRIKRLRRALAKEVASARDKLPNNRLLEAAQAEAGTETVSVTDLMGPDDGVAVSAAEQLLEQIRMVRDAVADFEAAVEQLMPEIPDGNKDEAAESVRLARQQLGTLSPVRVEPVLGALQTTIDELLNLARPPAVPAAFLAAAMPGRLSAARARIGAAIGSPRGRAFVDVAQAGAAVIATVLALMVLAVVTALSANWVPKHTFASVWDYAALVVSVFGSASIVGIVGAALLLRSPTGRQPGAAPVA